MSNMMIYATLSATGGTIESVYGHKMRVQVIDEYDEDLVKELVSEGWSIIATEITEQIETQKLEAENEVMKGKLSNGDSNKRIKELEVEIKELKAKLAIYESSKDTNKDGKVSYDEMTNAELQKLLEQRKVEYNKRDGKDALIKAAKDSE